MSTDRFDLKNLFDGDNFSEWARQSFANDEFSSNLDKFVVANYGDVLRDYRGIDLDNKLNDICDEIIHKYDIDEVIVRDINNCGFYQFHMELNSLEMNIKKLDSLEELLTKVNDLAKVLGVPDNDRFCTNDDCEEELEIATDDDDVQIVTLTAKTSKESTVKESVNISNCLQFVSSKELLYGFRGAKNMPVFVKVTTDLWMNGIIDKMHLTTINVAAQRYDIRLPNNDILTNMTRNQVAAGKSALTFGKIYPVGTRVVSTYCDDAGNVAYFSGIVAEPPGSRNSYRYLIFFDDGYVQYSTQDEVYLVFQQNLDNWKNMNPESQDFVKSYLDSYPERPMVRMKVGQIIKIEYNSEWCPTRVEKVDASLAYVCFDSTHREWIYRGSTRIEALYRELVMRPRTKGKRSTMNNNSDRAVVEYTRNDDKQSNASGPMKTCARKSSSRQRNDPDTDPYVNYNISDIDMAGTLITTLDNILKTRSIPLYTDHECNRNCVICRVTTTASTTSDDILQDDPDLYKGCNPLEIPIHAGWFRVKSIPSGGKINAPKSSIYYVSPCGHRLRNITELDQYLTQTNCLLTLDLFSFEVDVRVNREFQVLKVITNISDISYGKENVLVPCVNSVDNDVPPYIDYMPCRHRHDGEMNLVPLDENPEFLTCCDCTDNCKNKAKCACQQLTIEHAKASSHKQGLGYVNKRLYQYHPGGVFECNSRCACQRSCRNRIVQYGLWNKIQIFKTEKKGWGIRTLHDIPRGAFVCIYAGTIYNEEAAVEEGRKFGDEYQAELDYIETLQEHKEGYESDVVPPDDVDSDAMDDQNSIDEAKAQLLADSDSDSDDDISNVSSLKKNDEKEKEIYKKRSQPPQERILDPIFSSKKPIVTSVEGNVGNLSDKMSKSGSRRHTGIRVPKVGGTDNELTVRKFDIRSYLGDPNPFIMDAKRAGNLGRYFNHSCAPNLFVQNVFITSHDLRYPEVAFFAKRNIEAGEEITWDYMYRVGSVPDKVLYCYCGSPDCRGRLL